MKHVKPLVLLLLSILLVSGCVNMRLKKDYRYCMPMSFDSPEFVEDSAWRSRLHKRFDVNMKSKEYVRNIIQRSLLSGLLLDYLYKSGINPKNSADSYCLNSQTDPSFSYIFEGFDKQDWHPHFSNIISFFPPTNYSLPMNIDTISFKEILSEGTENVDSVAEGYLLLKVNIKKNLEYPIDSEDTSMNKVMYFEDKDGAISKTDFKVSSGYNSVFRFSLDNLIVLVKKDFYYHFFEWRGLFPSIPYKYNTNYHTDERIMLLSDRFLQYPTSRESFFFWLAGGNRFWLTDDYEAALSSNFYRDYFQIILSEYPLLYHSSNIVNTRVLRPLLS